MQEIDAHEVAFLLDQLIVISLLNHKEKERFIEDVM